MTHDAHAVAGSLDLLGFLLLGLLGGATHCAAMCGPMSLLVSDRYAQPASGRPVMAAQLWYSAGRTVTYAALGSAAGYAGAWLQMAGGLAGLARGAAAFAGGALVISGVVSLMNSGLRLPGGLGRLTRVLYQRLPAHPFSLGLILGLLPCGLLYSAVLAAVAQATPLRGAAALGAFAAGTVPSLLAIAAAQQRLRLNAPRLVPAANVFVVLMGLWYLWRGLLA